MTFLTKKERLEIVMDIVDKLRHFRGANNTVVNLYNEDQCHFVAELKQIFDAYIKQEEKEFRGVLYFEEINKNIEYILPGEKEQPPLFVIRGAPVNV